MAYVLVRLCVTALAVVAAQHTTSRCSEADEHCDSPGSDVVGHAPIANIDVSLLQSALRIVPDKSPILADNSKSNFTVTSSKSNLTVKKETQLREAPLHDDDVMEDEIGSLSYTANETVGAQRLLKLAYNDHKDTMIVVDDKDTETVPTGADRLVPCCLLFLLIVFLLLLSVSDLRSLKGLAPYIAEFVGTAVLVFTVACVVYGKVDDKGDVTKNVDSTWGPTVIGCVLMVMVYVTGPISGGNLNPAVSFGLGLVGELEWSRVVKYWIMQVLGGVTASAVFSGLIGGITPLGTIAVTTGTNSAWYHAGCAEALYTCMLVFVVLNCAVSKANNPEDSPNQFFGLAIGFVIIAGGHAVGGISGAAFNPAVVIGRNLGVFHIGTGLARATVWCLFEMLGAFIATFLYRLVRPDEFEGSGLIGPLAGHITKLLSEFIGTFFLVLTVGLNLSADSPSTAFSAAAALLCMIYSLGNVSGANFNPAVTVAVLLSGRWNRTHMGPTRSFLYILTQLCAGACAGLVYSFFHKATVAEGDTPKVIQLTNTEGHSILVASTCEFFFTFVLTYVILAVVTTYPPTNIKTAGTYYYGLAIASCVTAGGVAIGGVSGGVLNPAVGFGISISNSASPDSSFVNFWIFSCAEILGGVLAAVIFRVTHPAEYNTMARKQFACYWAEFVGTFTLVFTVGCVVTTGAGGVWGVAAIASVLMVMIYATAPVSGGNLNPAVSFALGLVGKLKWDVVLKYMIVQILAGVLAGLAFQALFWDTKDDDEKMLRDSWPVRPTDPFNWPHAATVEMVYTFMLCFVVLNCAVSEKNNPEQDGNQFFALAIGFVVVAGGYAVGGISGACFNPAVVFGLEIPCLLRGVGYDWSVLYSFLWAAAELVGAFLAVLMYCIVRYDEDWTASAMLPAKLKFVTTFSAFVSEFLGTFMLVLTVGLNVIAGSSATAFSAAAALMCMVYSLGNVSGAHFNPAVTFAVVASGRDKCSVMTGICHITSQILAAICAGLMFELFHMAGSTKAKDKKHPLIPGKDYSYENAGVAEFIFTFVLAYAVLAVATTKPAKPESTKQNFQFGLVIGSCVTAGGFAVGAISGGELNPAVALGISVASRSSVINLLVLSAWELSGGLLAAVVFRMTHPEEFISEKTRAAGRFVSSAPAFVPVSTGRLIHSTDPSSPGRLIHSTDPGSPGNPGSPGRFVHSNYR